MSWWRRSQDDLPPAGRDERPGPDWPGELRESDILRLPGEDFRPSEHGPIRHPAVDDIGRRTAGLVHPGPRAGCKYCPPGDPLISVMRDQEEARVTQDQPQTDEPPIETVVGWGRNGYGGETGESTLKVTGRGATYQACMDDGDKIARAYFGPVALHRQVGESRPDYELMTGAGDMTVRAFTLDLEYRRAPEPI